MQSRLLMQKKGMAHVDSKIDFLLGMVLVIVLVVALLPTIFGSETGLGNDTAFTGAPSWFKPVLIIVISFVLLFLIWKGKK